MSRPLPPALETRLSDQITARRWLLYLGYSPAVRLWTGQGALSWDGQIWSSGAFEARNIRFTSSGAASAEIIFSNLDRTLTALFLGPQGVAGIPASLSYYDAGEAVPIVDGYMDSADIANRAVVRIATENQSQRSAPRIVSGPPLANWITPAGTQVSWGNERLVVNRRGE